MPVRPDAWPRVAEGDGRYVAKVVRLGRGRSIPITVTSCTPPVVVSVARFCRAPPPACSSRVRFGYGFIQRKRLYPAQRAVFLLERPVFGVFLRPSHGRMPALRSFMRSSVTSERRRTPYRRCAGMQILYRPLRRAHPATGSECPVITGECQMHLYTRVTRNRGPFLLGTPWRTHYHHATTVFHGHHQAEPRL